MSKFSDRLMQALRDNQMTQAELADRVGISRSGVCQYCSGNFRPKPDRLHAIAEALGVSEIWLLGYDTPSAGSMTSLRAVRLKRFPLLGEIACGEPIFAQEGSESYVLADEETAGDFALVARGDSMIGAQIHDGDTVFIHEQPMVENGEIAAVVIGDEATLKRVYFDEKQGLLTLVAENPAYAPLVFSGEELQQVRILGRAEQVLSRLK